MLINKIKSLFAEQLSSWELAGRNFAELKNVKIRNFDFGDFFVQVQFNPARIRSTAAKIDKKSITERACFLCKKNRPPEQKSVLWGDYEILVNPYPIFAEHFTVVSKNHIPQQIKMFFADMLRLAGEISNYAVFYNGAGCGASAPEHLHFQVVLKNCLPIISDYKRLKATHTEVLQQTADFQIFRFSNYLRQTYCLETSPLTPFLEAKGTVQQIFTDFLEKINFTDETMMNVVCHYEDEKYYVFVFPRKAFRPRQYFAENEEENLLVSPAAVELSGVIITPRENDFYKITKEDIVSIYEQV